MPKLSLGPAHAAATTGLLVNENKPCLRLKPDKSLDDRDCGTSFNQYCIINYGGPEGGVGASIVTPAYLSDTITCGDKPTPPSEAKMKLAADDDQPPIMCPGEKALYECDASGINVRFDEPTSNTYEVSCKTDQTYAEPATWPYCVDKLDCSEPPIDDTTFVMDWTSGSGLTPPFDVIYSCVWANKKVVLKSDLNKEKEDSVADDLTIACQDNGTYDKSIDDYTCTRVCPLPSNPDPDWIQHDWTSDKKPEIYQKTEHSCISGQLVKKGAFKTGKPTTFIDSIMSMCGISGWMNETIGSYTCTRPCKAPYNYSEMFTFEYDEGSGDGSGDGGSLDCEENEDGEEVCSAPIGTKVK